MALVIKPEIPNSPIAMVVVEWLPELVHDLEVQGSTPPNSILF